MVRLRWRPVVTASSNAAAIPLRPRPRIVSIISCRCIIASQQIIASAVGNRRMAQHPVFRGDDAMGRRRLAVPREAVEGSDERGGGKEWVSKGRAGGWPE